MSFQAPNSVPGLTARSVTALCWALLSLLLLSDAAWAQAITNSKYRQADKFRQLEELLPTPNDYRTASALPDIATGSRRLIIRSMLNWMMPLSESLVAKSSPTPTIRLIR